MEHKLKVLRSVRNYGNPYDPCYAECVCGWTTEQANTLLRVGYLFDQHLVLTQSPLSPAPWRSGYPKETQ